MINFLSAIWAQRDVRERVSLISLCGQLIKVVVCGRNGILGEGRSIARRFVFDESLAPVSGGKVTSSTFAGRFYFLMKVLHRFLEGTRKSFPL